MKHCVEAIFPRQEVGLDVMGVLCQGNYTLPIG